MSLVLVRPTSQHAAANVLSATSEAGLTIGEPEPDADNAGTLRLRCSGTPTIAEDIAVELSTGGGPYGYAPAGITTAATGSAAKWRRTSEATSKQRGYVDSSAFVAPFLLLDIANQGVSSTPRELADGTLGFLTPDSGALDIQFRRYNTAGTYAGGATLPVSMWTALARPDFVVMPSGRLVALVPTTSAGELTSCYSDDNGDTWAILAVSNVGVDEALCCAEVVGDDVVLIRAPTSTSGTGYVQLSRDGGATFTTVATDTFNIPRTCVRDGVVYVSEVQAITVYVRALSPGGAPGTAVATGVACNGTAASSCIVARDDGTLWVFATEATADGTLDMDQAVSADGGATWTGTATSPLNLVKTAYANSGYFRISGGMFGARMIVLAEIDATTGTNSGPHLLAFGEWSNVGHNGAGKAYLPLDYPEALSWTRTNTGVGATVTNNGPLKLISAVADYTDYQAPTTVWAAATSAATLQFALKVTSGGSLANKQIRVRAEVTDGVDGQGVQITFLTTGARCVDMNNTQIGSDLSIALSTDVYEFMVGLKFDALAAGTGRVSIWYRVLNAETWTNWISSGAVSEVLGAPGQRLRFGNAVGAVTTAEWYSISVDDSGDGGLATATSVLSGRPLSAAYDYRLASGINLGAYGTGGVTGDTYTVATRYTYGADNVWTELRPSRRAESTSDAADWALTFDAGASDLFHGDVVAVFGTNMRTASWQMGSVASPWASLVTVALDATLRTFTASASGAGYITAAGVPNWRPGQYKSNGDSRRFFVQVYDGANYLSYEITDNDESRLYIAGVDLTGIGAAVAIFGDRMAARLPQFVQYRYARLYVTAQDTADETFRVGTPIFDRGWTPAQLYDFGFVERVEPNVATTDADNGASLSYQRGPTLDTLSIQWPPLDRLRVDVEERLRDFYRSISGSLVPVVLWRDTADLATLSLVQVREVYQATNVRGELGTALTRVDQLVLREVW